MADVFRGENYTSPTTAEGKALEAAIIGAAANLSSNISAVELNSGYRDGQVNHGKNAIDVVAYDANAQPVYNYGLTGGSNPFGVGTAANTAAAVPFYSEIAQATYNQLLSTDPTLAAKFASGIDFGKTALSAPFDIMHMDLNGQRGPNGTRGVPSAAAYSQLPGLKAAMDAYAKGTPVPAGTATAATRSKDVQAALSFAPTPFSANSPFAAIMGLPGLNFDTNPFASILNEAPAKPDYGIASRAAGDLPDETSPSYETALQDYWDRQAAADEGLFPGDRFAAGPPDYALASQAASGLQGWGSPAQGAMAASGLQGYTDPANMFDIPVAGTAGTPEQTAMSYAPAPASGGGGWFTGFDLSGLGEMAQQAKDKAERDAAAANPAGWFSGLDGVGTLLGNIGSAIGSGAASAFESLPSRDQIAEYLTGKATDPYSFVGVPVAVSGPAMSGLNYNGDRVLSYATGSPNDVRMNTSVMDPNTGQQIASRSSPVDFSQAFNGIGVDTNWGDPSSFFTNNDFGPATPLGQFSGDKGYQAEAPAFSRGLAEYGLPAGQLAADNTAQLMNADTLYPGVSWGSPPGYDVGLVNGLAQYPGASNYDAGQFGGYSVGSLGMGDHFGSAPSTGPSFDYNYGIPDPAATAGIMDPAFTGSLSGGYTDVGTQGHPPATSTAAPSTFEEGVRSTSPNTSSVYGGGLGLTLGMPGGYDPYAGLSTADMSKNAAAFASGNIPTVSAPATTGTGARTGTGIASTSGVAPASRGTGVSVGGIPAVSTSGTGTATGGISSGAHDFSGLANAIAGLGLTDVSFHQGVPVDPATGLTTFTDPTTGAVIGDKSGGSGFDYALGIDPATGQGVTSYSGGTFATNTTDPNAGNISYSDMMGSLGNNAVDPGAGGGGGDASTVLCTYFAGKGWLSQESYRACSAIGARLPLWVYRTYQKLATPLVHRMERGGALLESILWPPVFAWSVMASRLMRPKRH